MIVKTLAFILLLYLLIKFISGLFMPSRSGRKSTIRIIYQTFKNLQQHQQQQDRRSQNGNRKDHFEEIEEAEYEDITEDKS